MQIEIFKKKIKKKSIALGGFVCRTEVKRKRMTKSRQKGGVAVSKYVLECCSKEITSGQLRLLPFNKNSTEFYINFLFPAEKIIKELISSFGNQGLYTGYLFSDKINL